VEAPLAVVVALVADILPAGPGAPPADGGGPANSPEDNAVNAVAAPTADPAGDDEGDDALSQTTEPVNEGFTPEIEERLRKLDLSLPPEDQPWGGPIGLQPFLEQLQGTSDHLAACGPALSRDLGQDEDGFEPFSSTAGAWSSPASACTAFDRAREDSTGEAVDAKVWGNGPEQAIGGSEGPLLQRLGGDKPTWGEWAGTGDWWVRGTTATTSGWR
jgi:hypothetical protein